MKVENTFLILNKKLERNVITFEWNKNWKKTMMHFPFNHLFRIPSC